MARGLGRGAGLAGADGAHISQTELVVLARAANVERASSSRGGGGEGSAGGGGEDSSSRGERAEARGQPRSQRGQAGREGGQPRRHALGASGFRAFRGRVG